MGRSDMIKLKLILKEGILEYVNSRYPLAGDIVDGHEVLDNIDNTTSIGASLYNYRVLDGIREIPMSDFEISGKHYSLEGTKRIQELTAEIQESKSISPLIVVVDKNGPYVLEGSHRISALKLLNAKSFPALVVVDFD